MRTSLVLGAGFGGIACARRLRQRLPREHRIIVVDRAADFVVGATKTWIMLGRREPDEVYGRKAELLPRGVDWLQAEVRSIDAAARRVETTGGMVSADDMVIALGVELDMGSVPGLAEAADSFYTLPDASRLREVLAVFRGGRLLILIPRAPFQCPPAPYEAALLLDEFLRERGVRERTALEVWTVEPAPMPTAGPEMGAMIRGELEARGIRYEPSRKTASVNREARRVRFEDGSEAPYDLLIAVPPHRAPRVVVEAGLAEAGGWIDVDPASLEVRALPPGSGVYAVGDVTRLALPGRYQPESPLVLPKAGVFAAAEGEAVAERIAALAEGGPVTAFDGQGFCYLETGRGEAVRADGSFFALPHPRVEARPASAAQLHDKVEWVEGWLKALR